jgi:hypothetical protein
MWSVRCSLRRRRRRRRSDTAQMHGPCICNNVFFVDMLVDLAEEPANIH